MSNNRNGAAPKFTVKCQRCQFPVAEMEPDEAHDYIVFMTTGLAWPIWCGECESAYIAFAAGQQQVTVSPRESKPPHTNRGVTQL